MRETFDARPNFPLTVLICVDLSTTVHSVWIRVDNAVDGKGIFQSEVAAPPAVAPRV